MQGRLLRYVKARPRAACVCCPSSGVFLARPSGGDARAPGRDAAAGGAVPRRFRPGGGTGLPRVVVAQSRHRPADRRHGRGGDPAPVAGVARCIGARGGVGAVGRSPARRRAVAARSGARALAAAFARGRLHEARPAATPEEDDAAIRAVWGLGVGRPRFTPCSPATGRTRSRPATSPCPPPWTRSARPLWYHRLWRHRCHATGRPSPGDFDRAPDPARRHPRAAPRCGPRRRLDRHGPDRPRAAPRRSTAGCARDGLASARWAGPVSASLPGLRRTPGPAVAPRRPAPLWTRRRRRPCRRTRP